MANPGAITSQPYVQGYDLKTNKRGIIVVGPVRCRPRARGSGLEVGHGLK